MEPCFVEPALAVFGDGQDEERLPGGPQADGFGHLPESFIRLAPLLRELATPQEAARGVQLFHPREHPLGLVEMARVQIQQEEDVERLIVVGGDAAGLLRDGQPVLEISGGSRIEVELAGHLGL